MQRLLRAEEEKEQRNIYSIDFVQIHPLYTNDGLANDICVIRVNEKFVYGDLIQPIALPAAHTVLATGIEADIVGWGVTEVWCFNCYKTRSHVPCTKMYIIEIVENNPNSLFINIQLFCYLVCGSSPFCVHPRAHTYMQSNHWPADPLIWTIIWTLYVQYEGNRTEELQTTTIYIFDWDECAAAFARINVTITDDMMCAGHHTIRRDACHGKWNRRCCFCEHHWICYSTVKPHHIAHTAAAATH